MTSPVTRTGEDDQPVRESLRERKKRRTRATLARNAQRLFRERGFDRVTVAEIAASADVSVKTLFVYFASKEDLVFADEFDLLNQMRERLACRGPDTTASSAIRALAHELATHADDDTEGVVAFAQLIGDHPALHSRLQLMWEAYERALAETLAAENGTDPLEPRTRAAAAMLITPWRVLTSTDVRNQITDDEIPTWIDACFDLVDAGLRTCPEPHSHRPGP